MPNKFRSYAVKKLSVKNLFGHNVTYYLKNPHSKAVGIFQMEKEISVLIKIHLALKQNDMLYKLKEKDFHNAKYDLLRGQFGAY